jgi:hypothetical protein
MVMRKGDAALTIKHLRAISPVPIALSNAIMQRELHTSIRVRNQIVQTWADDESRSPKWRKDMVGNGGIHR